MRFLAKAGAGEAELRLYGQVGGGFWSDGITSKQVAEAVDECEKAGAKKLAIYINSPGGDVFEGIAILNCLKRFSGEKVVYVDGWAASIASVIAMAGDRIHMGSGAMMMVHDPRAFASPLGVGTADQMREKAGTLDKIASSMASTYCARTGDDEAAMRAVMKAETWMTAAEAVERKFADETFQQDEDPDASAFSDSPVFASFQNVPQFIRARMKAGDAGAKPTKESTSMFKNLLAKLGLTETATEAQAITAFDQVVGVSRKLIELTGAANEAQALGTVTAWKGSHDRVAELNAKVAKLEADTAKAEVTALVDGAIKEGKAAPAQRDSLLTMSPETLKAFIAAAPVIHTRPAIPPKAEMDSATLTAEEIEVAKKMNLDPKKFLEAKQKAIAEGRAPSPGALQFLAMAEA